MWIKINFKRFSIYTCVRDTYVHITLNTNKTVIAQEIIDPLNGNIFDSILVKFMFYIIYWKSASIRKRKVTIFFIQKLYERRPRFHKIKFPLILSKNCECFGILDKKCHEKILILFNQHCTNVKSVYSKQIKIEIFLLW